MGSDHHLSRTRPFESSGDEGSRSLAQPTLYIYSQQSVTLSKVLLHP
ncbi:hypothetical protein NPIL_376671, partial [Nephila pilipes]